MPTAVIAALITAAGTVAATSISARSNQPTATPLSDPETPEVAQREAEDKARRQQLAAAQRQSTILTSPMGINSGQRTILGG